MCSMFARQTVYYVMDASARISTWNCFLVLQIPALYVETKTPLNQTEIELFVNFHVSWRLLQGKIMYVVVLEHKDIYKHRFTFHIK